MAVYRANNTQNEYTVWPVQSAGGAKLTLCGQFREQVALYTHCVASSECRWRYTHCVASSECRNIQTGGAIHTLAVLRSNQILLIHLTA